MANEMALIQKDITDTINKKVNELQHEGLSLPQNYNHSNALKSAFFKLSETKDKSNRPALEVCTKESIANTLLDMVTQGLSPAKTQCYFIVYGDKLQMNRSYFGTQAVLKRLSNVKDIWANVIYAGDEFDYAIVDGREKFVKHDTKLENRDNEIVGAYAVVKTTEDEEVLTIMTIKEIKESWGQSKTSQAVHKKFPQEMAKRTVINRAAKSYINTSDDSDLLVDAINRTTENEYQNDDKPLKDVTQKIQENANQEMLDFEDVNESVELEAEIIEEPKPQHKKPSDYAEKNPQMDLLEPGF